MSDSVQGFDRDVWEESLDEVTRILKKTAKRRATIPYSEVTRGLNVIQFGAEDHRFHALLSDISRREGEQGRPLLTVVVVHKSGDMQPGPGFFELAKSLGRDFDDIEMFWIQELKRTWKYWSGSDE